MRPHRERDMVVYALTRDLGLVVATARGMRSRSSKLSSALLDLSLAKISLVKGRRSWRITTVTLIRNAAAELKQKRERLLPLARISLLLSKLIRGEEKHPSLYDEFESSVEMLLDKEDLDPENWELFIVAKILAELGYMPKDEVVRTPEEAGDSRKRLLRLVNEGLRASGLS